MRAEKRRKVRPFGYGLAAAVFAVALVVAPVHGVAYADPEATAGPSSSAASSAAEQSPSERSEAKKALTSTAPSDPDASTPSDDDVSTPSDDDVSTPSDDDVSTPSDDDASTPSDDDVSTPSDEPSPAEDSSGEAGTSDEDPEEGPAEEPEGPAHDPAEVVDENADDAAEGAGEGPDPSGAPRDKPGAEDADAPDATAPAAAQALTPAKSDTAASARLAVTTVAPVDITTPSPPKPLSPVAQLLELPARVINAVLQALGFTASAEHPAVPNGLGPINDLIFGAFREWERLLGLHRTPVAVPAVPTMTYDGPTDTPTPTVAQFLNASAAAYVLGGTPGGLVPFTVNGFQLSSTNIFTGMVGRTWVTPEGQVIIAYQGTTGGSHLLFNPLITISQIVADLQVIFTRTTPLAFYDALRFADRVLAEAALQGYTADNVFVTGHSLGGWEAQFVAQQRGLAGIGFEAPGMNTRTPGNGADSKFVNIGTYGSTAPYMSTDLPGLQPFMPAYVPGGGTKPHFGPLVMIGDPAAMTPLYNASALWGKGLIGSAIFVVDFLINFFQYHLPGVQAYHLDVVPDPGMVLFLGTSRGPVHTGYGTLTIPQLLKAASDDGILFRP
ncbi:hypothetical protein [Mycolicibacterium sp.]|uniref:hypothetical protein n=1 Tax=Mycolicibacterium sp. TaxID=2320850 RepID=UPI003D0C232A